MAKRNQYNRQNLTYLDGMTIEGLTVTQNVHVSGNLTVDGTAPGGGTTVVSHHSTDVSVSPGNILYLKFFAPQSIAVKNIKLYSETQLGSAAGSYFFKATGSSNSLLAAQYDLETLPVATLTNLTLTTTTAHLTMSAGDVVNYAFSSSNSDLSGSGLYLQMLWEAV